MDRLHNGSGSLIDLRVFEGAYGRQEAFDYNFRITEKVITTEHTESGVPIGSKKRTRSRLVNLEEMSHSTDVNQPISRSKSGSVKRKGRRVHTNNH
jgi:hypothetical protein